MEEMRQNKEEEVWNKIFPHATCERQSEVFDAWKERYLYPYADIAPLRD